MKAIEVHDVHKIYRRYGRRKQFATLKSALLSGSLIHDLQPDETFPALQGVSFNVPAGRYTEPTICDAAHLRVLIAIALVGMSAYVNRI